MSDQAVLQSLRVGQQIHADFATMKVSLRPDGLEICCAIVPAAGTTSSVKTAKDTSVAGTKADAAKKRRLQGSD